MQSHKDMKCHPLCAAIPEMTEREYFSLREDISGSGLLEPIVLFEGMILDGWHRYRACMDLEIEPWFKPFDGPDSATDYVISRNFRRRDLTEEQVSMAMGRLAKVERGGNAGVTAVRPLPHAMIETMDYRALECHPYCLAIPEMTEQEFAELKEDISGSGLLEPIVLFEGMILDGRYRFRACIELEIEPWFKPFNGPDSACDYVISKNLRRRDLSAQQRKETFQRLLTAHRMSVTSRPVIDVQQDPDDGGQTDGGKHYAPTVQECLEEFGIAGIHPAADLFPLMTGADFDELVESVGHHGLEDDIELTHDGLLLDGRNRLRACYSSGMPPRFVRKPEVYANDYPGYLARKNLRRRHLSAYDVAAFGERLASCTAHESFRYLGK